MNRCYIDLTAITIALNETANHDNDAKYLGKAMIATREIDRYTRKSFALETATRYFDGARRLPVNDLISITTFKLDIDGDGVYETTLASSDYILEPYNELPKSRIYPSIYASVSDFACGLPRGVEIAGVWGSVDSAAPWESLGVTITIADTVGTLVDVSAEGVISAGMTVLCGSEQMFVSSATNNNTKKLTVERGVNGTVKAVHAAGAASKMVYPGDIAEACLAQAIMLFRNAESAYSGTNGSAETGISTMPRGWAWDPLAYSLIQNYREVLC